MKQGDSDESGNKTRWEYVERGIVRERVAGSNKKKVEYRYYARVRRDGRNRMIGGVPSVELARALLHQLRDEAGRAKAGLPDVAKSGVTLRVYAPEYLAYSKIRKRSHERDVRTMRQLLSYFGDMRLTSITPSVVTEYISSLKTEGVLANATINRRVFLLRAVLSHAARNNRIVKSPLANLPKDTLKDLKLEEAPARTPVLDGDTEARLMAAIKEPWLSFLVRLALATGCRQGELLALKWQDFDATAGRLTVRMSKSGEPRTVYLPATMISDLRVRRGLPQMPIVTVADGVTTPKRERVTRSLQRAVARIGLQDFTFHDLRHICATRMLEAGAQLNEIADQLGHSLLHVTARYAQTTPNRMKAIMDRTQTQPVVLAKSDSEVKE